MHEYTQFRVQVIRRKTITALILSRYLRRMLSEWFLQHALHHKCKILKDRISMGNESNGVFVAAGEGRVRPASDDAIGARR